MSAPGTTYGYAEDSGYTEQFTAASEEEAEEHARELLRTGDYGPVEATLRLHAHVWRVEMDEDGPYRADERRVTATQEPDEPACPGYGKHEWQYLGAWGSGHGQAKNISECRNCQIRQIVDGGASCEDCGERYTQTRYERDGG